MDFSSWTLLLSLLLAGNVDDARFPKTNRPIATVAMVAVGAGVLVVGTAALSGYGAYALWGRVMSATGAFGMAPHSRPEFPPPPDEKAIPTAPAAETLRTPTPDVSTPAPPPLQPYERRTAPPVPGTPKASTTDAPPAQEAPISGSQVEPKSP